MSMAKQLTCVPGGDKEPQRPAQGIHTFRVTPRAAMQACQIMPEFRIHALDRIGLRFVEDGVVAGVRIIHIGIAGQAITEIVFRWDRTIHEWLQHFKDACGVYRPIQNTPRRAINRCNQVDFVFFCPTKVYSSSISITSEVAGCGGCGSIVSDAALIQFVTL